MIAELGHIALLTALVVAIFQSVAPLVGAQKGWSDWMAMCVPAAITQFALITVSFAAVTYSFIVSDFSLLLVAQNSNTLKPMLYKVAGVWGNHEGSLLLWVLILALYGALIAMFGRNLPLGLKARTLAVQGMIGVGFLAFMIFTSNPFERLIPAPLNGRDLNPLLQDPGLAFHPPMLYLGYVGLSTAFSFAAAALIEGRVDAAWARWVRPWALLAWVTLTAGIALGSWWAYYELGWGGWWFWDPVENASFMPWLAAIALLHSAIVVEKRSSLKNWTILMAILAFSLSLMGTFIVRSGVLTSVHAFASDPGRGVFILGLLVIAVGGSLALFAWRAPTMRAEGVFAPISREGGLVLNNLLMMVGCAVVFLGTLAPIFREMIDGEKISVGPPFFDLSFTPFMIVLFLALPLGAMLPWKRGDAGKVMTKIWWAGAAALLIGAITWGVQEGRSPMAPIGFALAAWVVLGVIAEIAERIKLGRAPVAENLRRLFGAPRSDWGKWVAHGGMGILIWGIAGIQAFQTEDIRLARPGDVIETGGFEFRFDGVRGLQGPNYVYDQGKFTVMRDGEPITVVYPEKRLYTETSTPTPTTEAGIDSGFWRDFYIALGDPEQGGEQWAVRVYVKPFANWIWGGAIITALGGLISLSDRRYRVGAATGAARRKERGAAAVPAE